MEKSDIMFAALGYDKVYNSNLKIVYSKIDVFEQKTKIIFFRHPGYGESKIEKISYDRVNSINMQELKAINEKCKELGWI